MQMAMQTESLRSTLQPTTMAWLHRLLMRFAAGVSSVDTVGYYNTGFDAGGFSCVGQRCGAAVAFDEGFVVGVSSVIPIATTTVGSMRVRLPWTLRRTMRSYRSRCVRLWAAVGMEPDAHQLRSKSRPIVSIRLLLGLRLLF